MANVTGLRHYPWNPLALGIVNKVPIQLVPEGAAYSALNWLTFKGRIELRRGYKVLGTDQSAVVGGYVTGLRVGKMNNGTQIMFRSRGMKLEYYSLTTSDWVEIGSNILGAKANGEPISIESYQSSAGGEIFTNSPSSTMKKIMTANPGNYTDLGVITAKVVNENLYTSGDANQPATFNSNTIFTGTLAFLASHAGAVCSAVKVRFRNTTNINHSELFTDNGAGILGGSNGGKGTINYKTGQYTVIVGTSPSTDIFYLTAFYTWTNQNYSGRIRIKQNRTFLWNSSQTKNAFDVNSLRLSSINTAGPADYPNNTPEQLGTGDGTTTEFTGTFLGVYDISVTDGIEVFTDTSGSGTLTGSRGGTGTVNYTTGAVSVTFNTAPLAAAAITVGYTEEIMATGNGAITAFSYTPRMRTANPLATLVNASITDGNETFSDTGSGTLIGSLGGTGTVNYTTGAVSVTFNTAPLAAAAIILTYTIEDSTASGLATFDIPTNRIAGNPDQFLQGEGGAFQNLFSLDEIEYCAHTTKWYKLALSNDDVSATNLIFRDAGGIPYFRAGVETQGGIYCIDVTDQQNPKFVLINVASHSTAVIPTWISENLDLSSYYFDQAVSFQFGDFIGTSCRTLNSPINNRIWLYNYRYKVYDLVDYYGNCFDIYNGALISGDSGLNNVNQLFTGFDDNNAPIANYWSSNVSKLGFLNSRGKKWPIVALKRCKKFEIEGNIQGGQWLRVFFAPDRGPWSEIQDTTDSLSNPLTTTANLGAFIKGSGSYVDKNQATTIGSAMIAQETLGDGSSSFIDESGAGADTVNVYHYKRNLPLNQPKFAECEVMFVAGGIGYVSITAFRFYDIRVKQDKPPKKYRQ